MTASIALIGACSSSTPSGPGDAAPGSASPATAAPDPTSPKPATAWKPGPEEYDVVVQKDVPIAMSDGVTLMSDITYPATKGTTERASGTFPVLLTQNPYGTMVPTNGDYFVKRGYIFIAMDVRGTTVRSPAPVVADAQFFGPRQAQDGVEAVDFAVHLNGSNGVVGLTGCSFLGISQIFTAAKLGPNSAVKAMAPQCASMGYEGFLDGGVATQALAAFALGGPTSIIAINGGFAGQLVDEIKAGGDVAYDRDFWTKRDMVAATEAIVHNGIPALLWSAWDALDSQISLESYQAFQNAYAGRSVYTRPTPGQPVTGRYQIVVGNGAHAAGLDNSLLLQWYDRWLKNDQNGIDNTATPMHLVEKNTGRWINTDMLPTSPSTPYYLDASGGLTTSTPGSAATASITWGPPTDTGGMLTYDSAAFDETKTIAGPIGAEIYASSTTTNLELLGNLQDLAPDGTVTRIADGTIIGSLNAEDADKSWTEPDGRVIQPHHPFTTDTPLTPGKAQKFDIKLDSIVYSVAAGHKLRFVLTTQAPADACVASVTSATGLPSPCLLTDPQKAALTGSQYTVLSGASTPSRVNIPLVRQYDLKATLACPTSTSPTTPQPVNWDGGTTGPREPNADTDACQQR